MLIPSPPVEPDLITLSIWSEAIPRIGRSHSAQGRRPLMISRELQDQFQSLTDALIEEEDPDAAWLASVLLAAQDSINSGELAAFAVRVWRANQVVPDPTAEIRPARDVANPRDHGRSVGSHQRTRKRGAYPESRPGPARVTRSRPGN
jgi:hypothetical protein